MVIDLAALVRPVRYGLQRERTKQEQGNNVKFTSLESWWTWAPLDLMLVQVTRCFPSRESHVAKPRTLSSSCPLETAHLTSQVHLA